MQTPKRLLVAADFSSTSEAALDYALSLAKAFGASLDVLYVHDADESNPRLQLDEERALQMAVDALVAEHKPTVPCKAHVRLGEAAPAIVSVAIQLHADALVLGTRGRRGFERMILGSVAEKVLRDAPAPTFLVHAVGDDEKFGFAGLPKHILVGLDFTDVVPGGASSPLDHAIDFAKLAGARLTLAHVHQAPETSVREGAVVGTRAAVQAALDEAKDRLEAMRASLKDRGVELDTVFGEGVPGSELDAIAELADADMIVIGTHGRKGIGRALLGSVAENTIRRATRPVLAFRFIE